MALLCERIVLPDGGLLVIELDFPRYRLSWRKGLLRISYESSGDGHQRCIRQKTTSYAFRSVEQMRYDFERDIEAAGGSLGTRA
jgi:hypothetical protein